MKYDIMRNELKISWNFHDESGSYAEEIEGMTFLAYWKHDAPPEMIVLSDEIKEYFEVNMYYTKDYKKKNTGTQVVYDLKIINWPKPNIWRKIIYTLLNNIMRYKPIVAYGVIAEEFNYPPDIFRDIYDSVWTALTRDDKFYFHSELMEIYSPLTREELKELDRYVRDTNS